MLSQDILLPQRLVLAVFAFEEDGAGFHGSEAVPDSGGDVEDGDGAAGEHVDGGGEDAGVIVEVLLEVTTQANNGLGGGAVTMDGHHRTRLNGVEHALGVVFGTIPKIQVHPKPRRRLGLLGEFIQNGLSYFHCALCLDCYLGRAWSLIS